MLLAMARRKKKRPRGPDESSPSEDQVKLPKAPERINNPFAALAAMKDELRVDKKAIAKREEAKRKRVAQEQAEQRAQERRKPKGRAIDPEIVKKAYEERLTREQAYAGVTRLGRKNPSARVVTPKSKKAVADEAAEAAARAKLDALVGGGHRFEISRDDEEVRGSRSDAHKSVMSYLADPTPEQEIDLHGYFAQEAERETIRFVRQAQRSGRRCVRVIFGKGKHSAGGVGVLEDAVIKALTKGAAPVVLGFRSAPARMGGRGAFVVRLTSR